MLRWIWMFLCSFAMLWLEIQLARAGILFPGALFVTFYFGISEGLRQGMICGMLTGACAEVILARTFSGLPLFLLVYIFLVYFRQYGDRISIINHALAGLGLGMLNAAYVLTVENLHLRQGWSLLSGSRALGLFALAALAGLVLPPLLIPVLDFLAARLGLPRFQIQTGGFLER